jgi:membrane-associated protease RseP (regulator of RpoE activity)
LQGNENILSVQVYIQGDLASLSEERKSASISAFAMVIGVSPDAIEVYRVYEGSVVFDLGVPAAAFQQLRSLLAHNNNQLRMLKVEKVILQRDTNEVEEWINEAGQFQLASGAGSDFGDSFYGKLGGSNITTREAALDEDLVGKLTADVRDIFTVVSVEAPHPAPRGTVLFLGDLMMRDTEAAYDLIAERWQAHGYTPLLRRHQTQVALVAQPGVVVPKPSNPWINLGLAIATIFSVLFTGAALSCQCIPQTIADWLTGLPMMLTMMVILLAHEFGHYFAARYHKITVTLPYFIPLPLISPVGTLGAFIQLRSPFKTKKQLFDIGVAGPLGGLIFAIPLTIWGVATSPINELTRNGGSVLEGNSVFYLAVKYLVHGQLLPNFDQYGDVPFLQQFLLLLAGIVPEGGGIDILINPIAFAAWFGLFVTAMNLLPVGQLDGGHVIYCILGDKARWLGLGLIGAMFLAGIFWWQGWLLWTLLVFFVIGPGHPPPLNDLVSLGLPRKILAYAMLLLFIILFMPNPLQPL